mmetsp:Transcript_25823/g.65520  ORF Transcript_25823/g.65520 Transcript_25823/m.65520 type:complete len:222 (+) Transcript_25823:330-995(+)
MSPVRMSFMMTVMAVKLLTPAVPRTSATAISPAQSALAECVCASLSAGIMICTSRKRQTPSRKTPTMPMRLPSAGMQSGHSSRLMPSGASAPPSSPGLSPSPCTVLAQKSGKSSCIAVTTKCSANWQCTVRCTRGSMARCSLLQIAHSADGLRLAHSPPARSASAPSETPIVLKVVVRRSLPATCSPSAGAGAICPSSVSETGGAGLLPVSRSQHRQASAK